MTTNKVVEKQIQELVKLLGITYKLDIKIIRASMELAYWTGMVEQMKEVEKQLKQSLWDVVPDLTQEYN